MEDPDIERREGEERYRSLLRTSPAPINLFDAEGVTVWGNDAVLELLGLEDRDELVGRSVLDFIHPAYHDLAAAEIESVIGAKAPVGPTPMELVRDDGEVRSVRVSTAPGVYRGEDIGQAIVVDDTPLVETRQRLENHRELIDNVLDTLPDLYFMMSPSGDLLDWNDRAIAVTGFRPAELRDLHLTDLLTPASAERVIESFSTLLDEGRDVTELDLVTKEGRRVPYEFHGGLLEDAWGEEVAIVAIGRDVSDRDERDRHLRVVDRMLRHNLRNKLNVIMGYAELVRSADAELTDQHIDTVLETCRRLIDTMDKERDIVSLLVEGTEPEPVDLAVALDRAVTELREDFPDATIELDPVAPTQVSAVPELDRAVRELVENGIVHNPHDRANVAIEVVAGADEVEVHIRDDGVGLPEIERSVFDGLEEGPLDHSQGLGLWFVHWVLDRSDARLEFETREDGSHLTVYLPRAS